MARDRSAHHERTPLLQEPRSSSSSSELTQKPDDARPDITRSELVMVISAVACGAFLAAFDMTVIGTIYPTIGTEFKAMNQMAYVATAYLLSNTAFQPLYGRLSDIFGRKQTLCFAQAVFFIGTLWCGVARSLWSLIIARGVAGIGGGGINVVGVVILSDLVSPRQRGIYQGLINICFAAGSASGAPGGGFMADTIGWRWAFLLQLPLLGLNMVYVYFFVPIKPVLATKFDSQGRLVPEPTLREKLKRIDVAGCITLVAAVTCFIVGLNVGGNIVPWSHPVPIGLLAAGFVLAVLFCIIEARYAREPIMPTRLVTARTPLLTGLSNFFATASYFVVFLNLPLFYRAARHLTASQAGRRLMPAALGGCIGSLGSGLLMNKIGSYYWILVASSLIFTTGIVLQTLLDLATPNWQQYVSIFPVGLGYGGMLTANLIALLATLLPGEMASATGLSYLFRSTGSIFGISLSAAYLQWLVRGRMSAFLSEQQVDDIRHDISAIYRLKGEVLDRALREYSAAMHSVFLFAVVLALVAVVCAAGVEARKLGTQQKQQLEEEDPRVHGPGSAPADV